LLGAYFVLFKEEDGHHSLYGIGINLMWNYSPYKKMVSDGPKYG
jgi:hypothetical protein